MSEYAPEEIMVKTVDNKLLVHAKHEEVGVVVSFNQLENRLSLTNYKLRN